MTSDGKPYGPWRYEQLVKECYVISKNSNTSFEDIKKVTPTERKLLLKFINEEALKTQELIEQTKNKNKK